MDQRTVDAFAARLLGGAVQLVFALSVAMASAPAGAEAPRLVATTATLTVLGAFALLRDRPAISAPAAASAPAPSTRRSFHPAACSDAPQRPLVPATNDTCELDSP